MAQFGRFRSINTITAGICSVAYFSFHSVLSPFWRMRHSITENDVEKPIPKPISNLLTTVMNDMKLNTQEISRIKPFLIKGLDVKYVGHTDLLTGVSLGIPENFAFKDTDTSVVIMTVNDSHLPAGSRETIAIKSSLFLSEDAKKFALAQQIYKAKHPSFFFMCFLPFLLVGGANALFVLGKKSSSKKIQKTKIFFQLHVVLVAVWLYALVFDISGVYTDGWADFQAAKLGKSYLLGGIEFYQKLVDRNKAIKQLNENAPYTEDGDKKNSLFRRFHMSFPRRIIYLKELKRTINTNQKEPSVWDYVFYYDN